MRADEGRLCLGSPLQFWYWNTIEQMRLLILVVIATFGRSWSPFEQLHAFIFVLVVSIALSLWLKPLKFASKLEILSQSAMVRQMLSPPFDDLTWAIVHSMPNECNLYADD